MTVPCLKQFEFYLEDDIGCLSMFLLGRAAISCSCAGYCSIW